MDVPVVLHSDHKSIFVNGVGGTKQSSKQQAQSLSIYVYNHGPRSKIRIDAVFNSVSNPLSWCERAYREVLEVLTRQEMIERGDGTVRTVIFAHSHGGKVVREALNNQKLMETIENKYDDIKSQSAIANIRKQTVVITFGSVDLLSEDQAKIVMNFRAGNDYMARVCHYIGIGTQAGKSIYYRIPTEPQEQHQAKSGFLDSLTCSTGSSSGLSAKSGTFSSSSSSSRSSSSQWSSDESRKHDESNPHYLDKYIECNEMMEYIVKILGLQD